MKLGKQKKILLAAVIFLVLAAAIGGGLYWKANKDAKTQKIGAEQETEDTLTDTSTQETKYDCIDCGEEEEPTAGAQPIEPLVIDPTKETPKEA